MKKIAVLTGDIVNSREGDVESWMNPLKETLNRYGNEPKSWEIYRGDSFQLSLSPSQALIAAIHIKSTIKRLKIYDVKLAIGIGAETYCSTKITESNGSAYVYSGECYDGLKKYSMGIKSGQEKLDELLNIMVRLSLLTIDNWSSVVSNVIKTAIENPKKNQVELGKMLNKSQSNISEAFARGGYDEILEMNRLYEKIIAQL